jgi:hypothetical protein
MSDEPALPILASDAERRATLVVLRDAVVEGRLTLEEYSDRCGEAVAARTDQALATLVRDLPAPAHPAPALATTTPAAERAICSHLIRRGPLQLEPVAAYVSVFGTIDLDLRDATLPGQTVDLTIRNIFGTVTVLVPEGVGVTIDGGGLFASQKVDVRQQPLAAGGPVIRIHASGPGGTIYVRTTEPSPAWPT